MNELKAFDKERGILIHDVEASLADRIIEAVPEIKKLNNGYIASKFNLYNLQMLTWFGLPVIKPLDQDYDWPIHPAHTPLTHQKTMANFLVLNPRSFNLSDPGTMKTLAALWAADYIMQRYPKEQCRCVIVCTKSTMQQVWASEIFRNLLGRRTFVVLRGTAAQRLKLLEKPYDFYITNYEGLNIGAPKYNKVERTFSTPTGLYQNILTRGDIKIAIIDEASAYRDSTSQRHRVARALLQHRDYLWLLTGTPCAKGPLNAYGLHRLIHPKGESFLSYRNRIMFKSGLFKWFPLPGATKEAFKLLQPSIRYDIKECVELPPQTTQARDVEMSPTQKKALHQLKLQAQVTINDNTINAVNEAVLRLKLLQIACGAVYGPEREINKIDAIHRIQVVKEILDDSEGKTIVFAPFRGVLYLLEQELADYDVELMHGDVSSKERDRIFSLFQNSEDIRVLVADPGTMAHGLTLTAAKIIIWYAPTDKTEIYLQANKRIDRPGQTSHTTVFQLAGIDIEREIYRRNREEQSMQGLILKWVQERRKHDE